MDPSIKRSIGTSAILQNVLVMRHSDRIDNEQPLWISKATRPWDPPLETTGKIRACTFGKKLRSVGFPIHRVIVSPFLRCLQTAAEVVRALCAVVGEDDDDTAIDASKVKVSIEYGLCEIIGPAAIPAYTRPKDGKWFPDIADLEAVLPAGTIDHSAGRIYESLPQWEEPIEQAGRRYEEIFVALADKFPNENLLLVTHGEGVGVAVSSFSNLQAFDVEYCAFAQLQRQIRGSGDSNDKTFKMILQEGQTGIAYITK